MRNAHSIFQKPKKGKMPFFVKQEKYKRLKKAAEKNKSLPYLASKNNNEVLHFTSTKEKMLCILLFLTTIQNVISVTTPDPLESPLTNAQKAKIEFNDLKLHIQKKINGSNCEPDNPFFEKLLLDTAIHFKEENSTYNNDMYKILQRKDFRLLCADKVGKEDLLFSAFNTNDKTLYVNKKSKVDTTVIHHQFLLMGNFYRHRNNLCHINNIEDAFVPVFPFTKKNMREYQTALEKGDNLLKNFLQLLATKKLTPYEKIQLNLYKKGMEDCAFTSTYWPITEENYKELLQKDYDAPPVLFHLNDFIGSPQIHRKFKEIKQSISVEHESSTTVFTKLAFITATNIPQSIIITLTKIREIMLSPTSAAKKLAQREAVTMEGLTEKAIEIFYADAYALKQKYIKDCPLEVLEENNKGYKMEL